MIDVRQPYETRPNRPRRDVDEERRFSTSNPERSYNTTVKRRTAVEEEEEVEEEMEEVERGGGRWKEPEEDFKLVLVRRRPPTLNSTDTRLCARLRGVRLERRRREASEKREESERERESEKWRKRDEVGCATLIVHRC